MTYTEALGRPTLCTRPAIGRQPIARRLQPDVYRELLDKGGLS